MLDIKTELLNLPENCGVYIMKDENGRIIYVGKAVNLRNRVRSYFRPANPDFKARRLAEVVRKLEYIVTTSEAEALVLENNLIKEHSPRYNIKLKDDKTYPYLKLTINDDYPRLFFSRKLVNDGAKYYGPFLPVSAARELLEIVTKIWPLKQCGKTIQTKARPCLNHHIGKCKAPCAGLISKEEYALIIKEVQLFLTGGFDKVIKQMQRRMEQASEALEFEKAAYLRDNIEAVRVLADKQKADLKTDGDRDYIAFAENGDDAYFFVFIMRNGKITGQERFTIAKANSAHPPDIISAFIKQFYIEAPYVPSEIITQHECADKKAIETYLSAIKNASVQIITPKRGEKLALINLAAENAKLALSRDNDKKNLALKKTQNALEQLQTALGLAGLPRRIEAFDISNTQGVLNTGGMVVFEDGKPKRKDYRKFKVSVDKADDCACMEEVVARRFMRYQTQKENTEEGGFAAKPDIVFADGGAGQTAAAIRGMREAGVSDIPVCGIVKDDKHNTRGLFFNGTEVALPRLSEGFLLITRIQDEMHRFAYEYHKKLRADNMVKSVLDDIIGIGAARRSALIKHFGDIEKIKAASADELCAVKGLNKNAAQAVYDYFHEVNDNGEKTD